MEYVFGIDLGTSYFKACVVDRDGVVLAIGKTPVPSKSPDGIRVELPIGVFWRTLRKAVAECLAAAGVASSRIKAVAYASQANSFLLLDHDSVPITPLILWPDTRVTTIPEPLIEIGAEPGFLESAGTDIIGPLSCISKLLWLQEHDAPTWERAARIMTISDYLVYGLTGEKKGDAGTAALLGLWDSRHMMWRERMLSRCGLRLDMFSELHRPGEPIGWINDRGAENIGLRAAAPVCAGTLDHHAAGIGAGVGSAAGVSESTGTVMACLDIRDRYEPVGGCVTGPDAEPGRFYRIAFSDAGGSLLEWYQANRAPDLSFSELDRLVEETPPGSGGLFAAPLSSPVAGSAVFLETGEGGDHGRHFRAIMESLTVVLLDLIQELSPGEPPDRIISTGGGAGSEVWQQIKADLCGTEFLTTSCPEPASLGAAMLAAVGAGWERDTRALAAAWITPRGRFVPREEAHAMYRRWLPRYRAAVEA